MVKPNLTVIDGDSIAYICSKDNLATSIENVDNLISEMLGKTGSNSYYLFLSKGPYFRHKVSKAYKNKRSPTVLLFVKTLIAYMQEKYGGIIAPGAEADDMIAYCMLNLKDQYNVTSCAIDKDVISQVPGRHYNYKDNEFLITTPNDALTFVFKQTLMGDSTDNIPGLKGVGEVGASAVLENCTTVQELHTATLNKYVEKTNGIGEAVFQFQQNFRQVYLLRTNTDFINEGLEVPVLPEPSQFF